jgi:hypothetical protein
VEVLYDEDLASHIGPESCGSAREGRREASTGERAGRPLSRDSQIQRGADVVGLHGRQHGRVRYCERPSGPRVVVDPGMHGRSLLGNREISRLTAQRTGRPASGRPEGRSR